MKLNSNQWHLIAHSLGINLYNAEMSKHKKDKTLPIEFYRNYFCSSEGSDDYKTLKDLETKGYTLSWKQYNNTYFKVTEKGISEFKDYFIETITKQYKPLNKSAQKYQDYLDADTGETYEEFLGIIPPKLEHDRYTGGVRYVSQKYNSVKGEYSKTLKQAKISYKLALKKYRKNIISKQRQHA